MGSGRHVRGLVVITLAALVAACSDAGAPDAVTTTAPAIPDTGARPATTAPPASTTTTTTADAARTAPTLEVDPATDLLDGQIIMVTATGLRSADAVIVGVCRDTDPLTVDDCEPAVFTRPEGRFVRALDGSFETPFRMPAVFTSRAGDTVDCRDPAIACLLVAASVFADDPLEGPYASIELDPTGDLAVPGVSVTADTGLVDLQAIGVAGWGFDPGAPIAIGQCLATDDDPAVCETEVAVFAPRNAVDATGRFDVTAYAKLEFDAYDVGEPVSCRAPAACELVVESSYESTWGHPSTWRFPLSFAPGARLAAPPEVSVTPSTGLADGDRLAVTADSVFATAHSLHVILCSGALSAGSCDPTTDVWTVDVDVDFDPPLVILARALLTTADGRRVDCRTSPDPCYVAVAPDLASSPRRWGTAPLAFDPARPLAPPPSVRIVGGGDASARDYVTVVGGGFAPSSMVQAAQCATGTFGPAACNPYPPPATTTDDEGNVEVTLPVLATAGPADCGVPGRCEVRLVPGLFDGDFDARTSGAAPITVRALDADERWLEPVFEEVEHRPGIVYGTGLDNDGRSVELTLELVLPRGDDAIDRPVLLWAGDNADEFARRGFVVVTAPTNVPAYATRESIELAYRNTVPVLEWLDEHADELRIDTDRIAAAGSSRGGFIATSLAFAPVAAAGERPQIAAAVSIAGGSVTDLIEAGEPPVLMFHGDLDGRVPIDIAEATCRAADAVGVRCELVVYAGRGHELSVGHDLIFDMWDRTARFLVAELDLP